MSKRHQCKYWKTFGATFNSRRVWRYCGFCGRRQFKDDGAWRDELKLKQFAEDWLPAISGTDPVEMMTIKVAFPFEWDCYESWNTVFKVKFHFYDLERREAAGRKTRVDVMNGWESKWATDLNLIDLEARKFYEENTGRKYAIGDNADDNMRRIIQS